MPLSFQVLGAAGADNALLVRIDTGQAVSRLVFDCGDGCLDGLSFAELQAIEHLAFSHLHMDHVAGFDQFFRANYERADRPNHLWGPPGTAAILQHRFQGYLWNLVADRTATWHVHEVHPERIVSTRFELAEAFAVAHPAGERPHTGPIFDGPGYRVEALTLDHGTPSLGYVVREADRTNVDTARLAARGLRPGPWLKRLSGPPPAPGETVVVGTGPVALAELYADLVRRTSGGSVAYLTDFWTDAAETERLAAALNGVTTLVCECQYRDADAELADRNRHMTAGRAAALAARAGASRLVLFHLSDRYRPPEWRELRDEARAVFPAVVFPDHWNLDD